MIQHSILLFKVFFFAIIFLHPERSLVAENSEKRPNIVFLLADDVNADTWGVYGSKDCKTPNIDQLAKDGMRFDHAYASTAMCAPFRQELYSGRTPWRTGTLANHSKSKKTTKSLPHYLKPLGYRVLLMGKSHVGPKPCYPFELIPHGDKKKDHNPFYLKETQKIISDSKKKNQPFCLFIASNDGHGPYTTGDQKAYEANNLTIPPYWIDTPNLRRGLVKYYAEITNFDKLVGDVRSLLVSEKQWNNTLFIVCSEQGTSLPFAKWTCYRNGLRSALIASWPQNIPSNSVANELISISDITPTLVDIAGGKPKKNDFDGKSFSQMLKGEKEKLHNHVFGAFTNCNILGSRKRIFPIRVIRTKTHSLLYNPNHQLQTSNITLDNALGLLAGKGDADYSVASSWVQLPQKTPMDKEIVQRLHHRPKYELYNLKQDPHELENIYSHEESRAIANQLKKRLHEKLNELGDANPVKTEISLVH